ncbi:nucleoside hydrolase, partial [Serratia marcescens]|uniref:nucleoside hydrolase n=1 Tax=Serratia marcescens TaxID=615 RepID=UPI003FA7DE0A
MPRPIIIDCDPGLDDAIALAMALRSPELDVKAITTSAGNQTPEKTLRNALGLLTLMGREDIPVAAGAGTDTLPGVPYQLLPLNSQADLRPAGDR